MSALESIHSHGILHNDLKQSHVLLCDGMPKFIDFEGSSMGVSNTQDFENEIQCMRSLLEEG
jgi:serine/threonine protein kinase